MRATASCRGVRMVAHRERRCICQSDRITSFVAALALILCSAPVAAQGIAGNDFSSLPVRFLVQSDHGTGWDAARTRSRVFAIEQRSPSVRRHILVGAGIGAAAGAIFGATISLQNEGETMVHPALVVAVPMIGGGAVGALVGYLVYLSRRERTMANTRVTNAASR